MTQEELEQIEISNNEAKEDIKIGEAFQRLLENDDYKLVVTKGYLENYPTELAAAIAKNTGAYDEDQLVLSLKATNKFLEYGFKIAGNHMAGEQTLADNAMYVAAESEE